jgi:uncharacterized MnhB-related membrane protein
MWYTLITKAAALFLFSGEIYMTDFLLALLLITCALAGVSFHPKYDALIKRVAYTVLLVIGLWVLLAPHLPTLIVQ